MSVVWKGHSFDSRTRDMLVEVDKLTAYSWSPSQGSYSGAAESAGTHAGCGAMDTVVDHLEDTFQDDLVLILRMVGFAAWLRTPAQGPWPLHIHAIAVQPGGKNDRGCLAPEAHSQVVDYYNGRNGLANNGPDDGPRYFVGQTWESYLSNIEKEWKEDDMAQLVIVSGTSGAAFLLDGPLVQGIYDGKDVESLRKAGVPVADGLTESTFNSLKDR